MNMFKHIAVAYDGSDGGKQAVRMAASLLKTDSEAELTVLHVYDGSRDAFGTEAGGSSLAKENLYVDPAQIQPIMPTPINYRDAVFSEGANHTDPILEMESNIKDTLGPRMSHAKFEVLDGSPADSICRYAADHNVDLLIVGNSGKSGLEKFFMGSVSGSITKNSPCSVLVAK
ncbi:universal stress protein [Peribacillus kribbensis]|uniref:universal stress protein n=1 Tax=Peribacillus kribbensis TaxID=356658 RepID=UPI00041840B2|nr:universal stress protein [Peribacillus kribbensis]